MAGEHQTWVPTCGMENELPLIRNNGRYGELGHWGKRSGRRFTKKKILLLGTLLSFSLIFAISHNGNIIPVVNAADYNSSFSHTRTLIFGDTQFLGPKTMGQTTFQASTFVDQCTITCSSPTLATSSGNFLMVHTDCWSSSGADIGTVTDTLANTFTRIVSQTFGGIDSIWKASSAGGSDSVIVSKGTCGTFSFSFEVYSGATGLGVNNQDLGSSGSTSGGDTLTMTISSNSLIYEAWSVSNGNSNCPTVSAGSGQSLRETFTCFVTGGNRLDGSSLDKQFIAGGSTPSTANWGNGGGGVTWSHMVVELLSGSASLDFSKVRWNYNSTCVSLAGPISPEADFDYSIGNSLGQTNTLDSYTPATLDDHSNIQPPLRNTGNGETFTISGNSWQIAQTQFKMNQTGNAWTGQIFSQIYAISGTPGTNALPTGPALATSTNQISAASLTTGLAIIVSFTFTNTAILNPGNYMVTINSTQVGNNAASFPKIWSRNLAVTGRNDAFQANATAGWHLNGNDNFWFTVTGLNTNPGINCSSADIMISKSSINLQTVSARMLEIVMAWANVKPALKNVTMVLRASNGTLPSFKENYNPFLDNEARLIWDACPVATCSPSGNQTLYIGHDLTKTISQESLGNDKIIGVTNPNFKPGVQNSFQVVLNFTGPINFISGSNQTSTTINSASGLQMGQDYYILIMANFDTTQTPASCNCILQFLGGITSGTGNPSLGIWSVPASCQDPINRVACGLGTPQPTFDFNPLDPSTWGNAIIKGLVWAFSVAVPSGLLIITRVLLQVIQVTFNFVGNQFGWGNIGDNIVTFLNSLPSLFGQIGTALGWFASIVSSVINTIIIANLLANPYFAGLVNILNDFKNAFGSGIIISFLTQIAFWFPTSYMIILISTYFLFVFLGGLHGFFDWLHLVKWTSFQLVGLFSMFIDVFVSLITAILGRLSIISPGHKFPRIPHPSPGSLPRVSLNGEIAFFDDPTAWFLAFTGFIFTMMWAGTSSAGLPANTQTIIQSMSTLFLTLFGVGFMVLLLYIPGFILAKLYEKGILS